MQAATALLPAKAWPGARTTRCRENLSAGSAAAAAASATTGNAAAPSDEDGIAVTAPDEAAAGVGGAALAVTDCNSTKAESPSSICQFCLRGFNGKGF